MKSIYFPSNPLVAANDDLTGRLTYISSSEFNEFASSNGTMLNLINQNKAILFKEVAYLALKREILKCSQGEITKQTLGMFKSRLYSKIGPFFNNYAVCNIGYEQISQFVNCLNGQDIQPVTIKHYLGLLKRILGLALEEEHIHKIPKFPKIKAKSIPRGSFTCREYRQLIITSRNLSELNRSIPDNHRVTAGGAYVVRDTVPVEMTWLIQFMVNSFVRPVDIKLIKHKHIESIEGVNTYLRLSLPKTKGHTGQIVTLRSAKFVYDRLKKYQLSRGYGADEDYLFLPEARDREGAIQLITTHFRKILKKSGLNNNQEKQRRTLYSLRHTAITFRLLYGKGIDLLTLARNARTSVEMIERFYSSNLTAEMNIEMLQSKRTSMARA